MTPEEADACRPFPNLRQGPWALAIQSIHPDVILDTRRFQRKGEAKPQDPSEHGITIRLAALGYHRARSVVRTSQRRGSSETMAILSSTTDVDAAQTKSSWFTRPLAGWACVLGWCVAAGVFVAGVAIPGGPAVGDAWEIIYPTWAISHGQLVCVYPPHPESISTFAAPMYPIIAGAIGFVTRIGDSASFPSGTALGHGCSKAVVGMVRWSQHGGAVEPTLRTGYVAGLFLLVGLILLLRATVRGRTGWEPAGLVLVACVPPVWFCIEMYAHPQDVVALGFALAAMACALRNRWVWAGILIALAVLTQQYTLLVAIPLLVVAPSARRLPYVLAAIVTAAVVAAPLLIATSERPPTRSSPVQAPPEVSEGP